jgi:hypothetical protein
MVHPKRGNRTTFKKCHRKRDNFYDIKDIFFNFGNKTKSEK